MDIHDKDPYVTSRESLLATGGEKRNGRTGHMTLKEDYDARRTGVCPQWRYFGVR